MRGYLHPLRAEINGKAPKVLFEGACFRAVVLGTSWANFSGGYREGGGIEFGCGKIGTLLVFYYLLYIILLRKNYQIFHHF